VTRLDELQNVARKFMSILTTSASAERIFSVAGILCGERQMAMMGDPVSARMMVQANLSLSWTLLQGVLAQGPHKWAEAERARQVKKLTDRRTWRFASGEPLEPDERPTASQPPVPRPSRGSIEEVLLRRGNRKTPLNPEILNRHLRAMSGGTPV
jgi:hypothetical protein